METSRKTAFITGATSGIGKEFAGRFAAQGYDLIITGRRRQELKNVAENIASGYHVNVEIMTGDLVNSKYRRKLCQRITECGQVDVLVNNAGFGTDHTFYGMEEEGIKSMLLTHTIAPVELIHAVLPGMIARKSGTIINVSSLGAFIPGFTRSLYLGTKSFVHNFSEGLSTEISGFGIKVLSLCPGMTVSDFHRGIHDPGRIRQMHRLPFMSAAKVVNTSLKALQHGWIFCIPGFFNKLLFVTARLLPARVLMKLVPLQH